MEMYKIVRGAPFSREEFKAESKASFSSYLEMDLPPAYDNLQFPQPKEQTPSKTLVPQFTKSSKPNNQSISIKNQENAVIGKGQAKKVTIGGDSNKNSKELIGRNGNSTVELVSQLLEGNNLVKFLKSHGLTVSKGQANKLKQAFGKVLSDENRKIKEIQKWEEEVEGLRELAEKGKLEKWMESTGLTPTTINKDQLYNPATIKSESLIQQKSRYLPLKTKIGEEPLWGTQPISRPLPHKLDQEKGVETEIGTEVPADKALELTLKPRVKRSYGDPLKLQDFKGRSLVYQENTLAQKLWTDFKEMSTAKQVGVVVGITVVTAAVGFLSFKLLFMLFPRVMSMNGYWVEVLSQWFVQRHEAAFNMLQHTAINAKPLSTTWANQYILWKYI